MYSVYFRTTLRIYYPSNRPFFQWRPRGVVSVQICFCELEGTISVSKNYVFYVETSLTLLWYEHRTEGVGEYKNRSVPKSYIEHFAPFIEQAEMQVSGLKRFLRGFTTVLTLFNGHDIPASNIFVHCMLDGMHSIYSCYSLTYIYIADKTNISRTLRSFNTAVECFERNHAENFEQLRTILLSILYFCSSSHLLLLWLLLSRISEGSLSSPHKTLLYSILLKRALPKMQDLTPRLLRRYDRIVIICWIH